MATIIAVIALLMIVVSLPLIFIKPHWVFYLFLISKVFGALFYGYIFEAGGLGTSRTWQPADFLAIETLIASFFVRRSENSVNGVLKSFLYIIIVLAALSLVQGLIFNLSLFALPDIRKLHFIATMLFALKYFIDSKRVDTFLKFTAIILTVVFIFHLLIRLGYYTPPEAIQRAAGQLAGERGERAFAPFTYLILLCIGLARLGNKMGSKLLSAMMILVAISGIALAESRTLQGAAVVIGLLSLVFIQGKLKNIILFSFAAVFLMIAASAIGFDVFARWRSSTISEGGIRPDVWRMTEYSAIAESYAAQPYFLMTGRGIGAVHIIPITTTEEVFQAISYYHSEFLGWLDMFGIAGLMSILIVWGLSTLQSLKLRFSEMPILKYYGTIVFLLMPAIFLHSIFSPSFMNDRGASLLICFVVIIANCREIYYNLQGDGAVELYQEGDMQYDH